MIGSELNKHFAFSPEFPVFSNIYDLSELSLSIGFHGGNCCLVMKQQSDFYIISSSFRFLELVSIYTLTISFFITA